MMQNFREKYAYTISLYLSLISVTVISFIAYFLKLTSSLFAAIAVFLIVFLVSFFLRFLSFSSIKKYLDLAIFIIGGFILFSLNFLSSPMLSRELFCEPTPLIDVYSYDCSSRGKILEMISNGYSLLLHVHFYIFLTFSFISIVLSIKYLLELRKRDKQFSI